MWTDNKGQDMKILCSECNKDYEEQDELQLLYFQNGCKMICKFCSNKSYENLGWTTQPERSKREDLERKCKSCSKFYKVNISIHVCDECFPKVHRDDGFIAFPRCGTLNTMET